MAVTDLITSARAGDGDAARAGGDRSGRRAPSHGDNMIYLNQPWFNRKIVNTIAMATGAVHSERLTVTKRASNEPQIIPITPVDVDGVKYLVSTRGESQWVKNVRNASNVALTTKSGTTEYVARETPVENRQPIIDAYKRKAGKIVKRYFSKLPDPADHPVFSLTPQ